MGRLDGRVAIVTGAGRGLGRAHAHYLAMAGAAVVVNDLGRSLSGEGDDDRPAHEVVAEIEAAGGRAVANFDDVADWEAAENLVASAVDAFGRLDILVNNAGILRDRTLANLGEDEWDSVLRVHLKGHAAPTRHAMSYWRAQSKAGEEVRASVIHTTSVAGFCGSFGQANYSAAKAAVVGLSKVVSLEGAAIGVRSNAVSPSARTRFTLTMPGADERLRPPDDEEAFDFYAPENVSPLVVWLAEPDCPANNQVFHCAGNRIFVVAIPHIAHYAENDGQWTPERLDAALREHLVPAVPLDAFLNPDRAA